MTNRETDSKESAVEASDFRRFWFKDFVALRTVGFYTLLNELIIKYV